MSPARARNARAYIYVALTVALSLAAVALVACDSGTPSDDRVARSRELTAGEFPDVEPPAPVAPPPPMLTEPSKAVYSYLVWISYAYRVLDSEVATHVFTPDEAVRVDSYVELNRQKGRALDQRLTDFKVTGSEELSPTAWRIEAREQWRYRYIDLATGRYTGAPHSVSYATTYTVVREAPSGWVVDAVQAESVGAAPR